MHVPARKGPYGFLPVLDRESRGGTVPRIQDLVRDAIVRLSLPPGAFIDKAALCAQLGVSRFPVSEALGRLADEGFVEVLPQRGTRVALIRLDDARQCMFIRRALETEAVRSVAPQADAALLAALRANLHGQEAAIAADDRAEFHALDLSFHDLILGALGYDRVRAVVEAARGSLDRTRQFLCTLDRQASTYAEHQRIVETLAERDPARAAGAMADHLEAVMAELMAFASAHPEMLATQSKDPAAA